MSVINNECIIATTWDTKKSMKIMKRWIKTLDKIEQSLFVFILSIINKKETLILGPSGSKKGWDTDIKIEKLRNRVVQKLKSFNYEDGSNPFYWVEVSYGEYGEKILRGNCIER